MSDYLSKIKSLGLEEQHLTDKAFSDIITYKNLKRSMGITVGNAIRRTLLSSVPGYAVRSVSIASVQHEFTPISGLKEDAQQLIMNLKKIVFKGEISKTKASLNIVGPCTITAKDITCANVSVVNPDLYLGSLDKGFNLKLEMNLEKGVGIKLARQVKDYEVDLGAIICDSFFSPIISVNFEVEEHETDGFEDLKLHIVTDGSISPQEAFDYSLTLLMDQFAKNAGEVKSIISENQPSSSLPAAKRMEILSPNLFLRVEDLPDISTRTLRCLKMLGIVYVGDLVRISKETLMKEPNFGENSLNKLLEKLSSMGLTLDMDIPDWPPENLATKAEEIRKSSVL